MTINMYLACGPCRTTRIRVDPASLTVWVDVYGRAVTEGVCPRCEESRRSEWDPTVDIDPVLDILRTVGVRVVRVGSILGRVDKILEGYERFGLPTDAELHAELDRLERRARRRESQA